MGPEGPVSQSKTNETVLLIIKAFGKKQELA
jgi:hypothetical protein